jgi:multidrug efflux pump subunit AcrA (membrane-fusion protein)
MKKKFTVITGIIVFCCAAVFIFNSFKRSSEPPKIAAPTDFSAAPVKVYGIIEPAGHKVFVGSPVTKRITEIYVKEGDRIKAGQRICDLENSIEKKEVELSLAKISLSQKSFVLSTDELKRTKKLFKTKIDSESKYTQAKINNELDLERIKVAKSELDVAKAKLEQTVLRSPIEGLVYKLDIHLGETLASNDTDRIVLGSDKLWVKLSVESFWRDKIALGSTFTVYDSETRESLGEGTVIQQSPYLGRRDFRTEDMQERFDTKFQEFILEFNSSKENIPIGLSVLAELN